MDALLVCGGEAPPLSRLEGSLPRFGLVCAADSGLDTLIAWGLRPDIIVGDMDSVSGPEAIGRFPAARVARASRDKDETDTELGLRELSAAGAELIVLAGGGGGRLDHLLAIRSIFERRDLRPAEWHTAREAVYLVRGGESLAVEARRCAIVSVFPLAAGAEGMESSGLKWPLAGLAWGPGDCGVSNVAAEGPFRVRAGRGDLLVVVGAGSAPAPIVSRGP
jgi:thiamine pyrophosphokinase